MGLDGFYRVFLFLFCLGVARQCFHLGRCHGNDWRDPSPGCAPPDMQIGTTAQPTGGGANAPFLHPLLLLFFLSDLSTRKKEKKRKENNSKGNTENDFAHFTGFLD